MNEINETSHLADTAEIVTKHLLRRSRLLEALEAEAEKYKEGALAGALLAAKEKSGAADTPAEPAKADVPEWVHHTPKLPAREQAAVDKDPEFEAYCLAMNEPTEEDTTASSYAQHMVLTREEYCQLKFVLAFLRGFGKPGDPRLLLLAAKDDEAEVLAAALESIRYSKGSTTPVEEFVSQILKANSMGRLNTVNVGHFVEDFEYSLSDVKRTLRQYGARHPWLLEDDGQEAA